MDDPKYADVPVVTDEDVRRMFDGHKGTETLTFKTKDQPLVGSPIVEDAKVHNETAEEEEQTMAGNLRHTYGGGGGAGSTNPLMVDAVRNLAARYQEEEEEPEVGDEPRWVYWRRRGVRVGFSTGVPHLGTKKAYASKDEKKAKRLQRKASRKRNR